MNPSPLILAACLLTSLTSFGQGTSNVVTVTSTPGLVAFWDFVKQEPDGTRRFTAHVPPNATTDYPLDAANYIKDYWAPDAKQPMPIFRN